MKGKLVALSFFGLGGLASCGNDAYIPDSRFVDLYVDLKLASVAQADNLEKANEVRRVILAQHGMSSSEFHQHYVALTHHPEAWKPFQETVVGKIEAMRMAKAEGVTSNGK
jgi:hypothetical protein